MGWVSLLGIVLVSSSFLQGVSAEGSPTHVVVGPAGVSATHAISPGKTTSSVVPLSSGLRLARENMPWLCMGCGLNNSAALAELSRMSGNDSGVSYIQYFVTSTGSFYCQCPDNVNATAHALGLEIFPMINSGDTEGADDLALIQHQTWWSPFINSAIDTALNDSYAGYNVDFEGTGSGTPPANTSADYAHFLWDFANVSHQHGLRLTVDYGWFDPDLWDPAYMSATSVDVFYDMDYYNWSIFWNRLDLDLANFPLSKLGIGLSGDTGAGNTCPGDVGTGGFAQRIHILESYNITHTAFWAMADWAVGNGCWDYPPGVGAVLHDFLYNGSSESNWTVSMGGAPNGWAFCPTGVSVTGSPLQVQCSSSPGNGMNITLYTANDTGSIGAVNLEGNETVTRTWTSPVTELRVGLWEYLDDRNVTLFANGISCLNGSALTTTLLPESVGGYRGTVNLSFPAGRVCGVRFGISTAQPGLQWGENDWFADLNLSFPSPLSVHATASVQHGQVPLTVSFNSTVSGGIGQYVYNWSFGDGNVSSQKDPLHTFTKVGDFKVNLTVVDGGGDAKSVILWENTTSPPALRVSASASPLIGELPLHVSFNASASGGEGGTYSFTWSFGDGSWGSGAQVVHTYNAAGNYTVTVVVNDPSGENASSTPMIVHVLSPLNAFLAATPNPVEANSPVRLVANVTGGLAPYHYDWAGLPPGCLGTDSPVLNCTPSSPGKFYIVLNVTDSLKPALKASSTITLNVQALPSTSSCCGTLGGIEIPILIASALVAAAVVAALLIRRRRRRAPQETEASPPSYIKQ